MKTRLLRRLRRRADKRYYIDTVMLDEGLFYGIMYRAIHEESSHEHILCEWQDLDFVENVLNEHKRKFIKNQVEQLRFKKLYK